MRIEEYKALVNQMLTEEFEVQPDLLTPDATLFEGLGLDSLDAVDLVVGIERKLGLRISEQDFRAMRTLGDIYQYIDRRVSESSAAT